MASSSQERKCDVFVSFRGEDTYKYLVSNLHTSLKSKGINYAPLKVDTCKGIDCAEFKDDDEISPISPEHLKSIEESRFAIIIFSVSYSSSTRCLEELTKVMECVRYKSQIPIPVFYGVNPSDVRSQTNSFGQSFAKHLENLKGTADFHKANMWREALTQAASISGWDVRNDALFPAKVGLYSSQVITADGYGNESERIGLIVDQIFYSIDRPVSAAEVNQVGTQPEPPVAVESGVVCFHVDPWVERFIKSFTHFTASQNEANQKWKYDAFLSFRGEDTHNNFVAHLYKRLEDIGINVFKDDVKLERGKHISIELLKAIEESRTAIVSFSEDYASSTWCLEELAMIMECVDQMEQKAYPVFYNVKPSDLLMNGTSEKIGLVESFTHFVAPQNEANQKWKYDAFLSFRGEDIRNNFVAHLYKRLEDMGISVFKDDVKLERGKHISTELLKAIEESRIAIIIFSEDYASSTWCLEELATIMECVDQKEQTAYPVFYNVEPSDLRMKGEKSSFAKALEKHVEDFKAYKPEADHMDYAMQRLGKRYLALREAKRNQTIRDNLEKVQRWKNALHRAAGIAGLDVRKTANGNEAKSIDKIINDNFRNMHHTVSATEKYLVGIDSRICEVESLLRFHSGGVCFVGIWGIGGIGKTTVARKYFDKVSHQFQGSCFLANVREESKKYELMYLQKTLLSRLSNEKSMKIASVFEGADMIKRKLCRLKVLIVFDDVDDEDQLEYLVGNHDWFGDGSRIITTTRNRDLLRSHDQLYPVPELTKDQAVEVFSWHTFQKRTPDREFLKLSKSVVDYAKGLPLALKVLGSFLYKRGMTEWRSALDKLRDTGYEKIVKQLSLSLEGLNHEEKNIFLDIACFFRGRKRDDVITILNSFGFRSEIGTDVLVQKSLLHISEGMVEMHDLIEQMGQQVVRSVDQDRPWNHSRLWHEQDIKTVFSVNQRTESIEGIMVPIGSDRHICKWSKAFENMPCLRLLIVKGEEARHHDPICDRIEYLPSNLKWLDWSYYSFATLPAEFEPGNLVGLNMTFSSLVEIFKEPTAFDKLTILNLSFSGSLLRTPNFCDTPNLQKIILKSCVSLVEIHPSIGNLRKLKFLNMENCKSLNSFPRSIQMESLESFSLSGCEKLEKFPEIRGNMELLSELLLAHTALWELPSSIGLLSGISLLDLRSCENLVRLSSSVCEMRNLKILIVKGCSRFANFPENLGDLNQLEELYAGNTSICQLPDSIGNLSKLKILSLRRGWKVKHQRARSLILPLVYHGLRELKSLDLSGCNLCDNQAAALVFFPSLLELNLSRNKFISLPNSLCILSRLRYLNITHCQELKELPLLPRSIEELYAEDFLAKGSIVKLPMYPRLNLISFTNYSFDQQSYVEERNGSSVLDEILSLFFSNNIHDMTRPSLQSGDRMTCSIVFPEHAIPTWFKHQSVSEKIRFKLPIDWYNDKFKGFAICCVTLMGAGVCNPDSRLSEKYDYALIKAKLICSDHSEDLKVLEKECKVGTTSRTYGWYVCFAYIPLYFSRPMYGVNVGIFNKYGFFEASIHGRIVRQWGVHLIYEDDRMFFQRRLQTKLVSAPLS